MTATTTRPRPPAAATVVAEWAAEAAPAVLAAMGWWALWRSPVSWVYFTVGLGLNTLLNTIVKGLWKQPRPRAAWAASAAVPVHRVAFNEYGMPSGHAQFAWFVALFVCLAAHTVRWSFVGIAVGISIQRVVAQKHTLAQVLVGAGLGAAMGAAMYHAMRSNVRGRVRPKPDDGALPR